MLPSNCKNKYKFLSISFPFPCRSYKWQSEFLPLSGERHFVCHYLSADAHYVTLLLLHPAHNECAPAATQLLETYDVKTHYLYTYSDDRNTKLRHNFDRRNLKERVRGCGLDLNTSKYRLVVRCFKHGNETGGSITIEKFLERVSELT
jgi:hypothetical protein